MKKLQQFLAVIVLTLVLAFPAAAGDILGPGVVSPPPQSSVTGEMSTPGASATGEISYPGVAALDPATETALGLLRSLLALF